MISRYLGAFLLVGLLGCSDGTDRAREVLESGVELPDAALVDAEAGAAHDGAAIHRDAGSEGCVSDDTLEFVTVCPDAAAPDAAAADAGPEDAAVPDAAPVDAGDMAADASTSGGPCALAQRNCSKPYIEVQEQQSECSFGLFDALNIRFRACEACGKAGYLFEQRIVVMDCGGCDQIYAYGAGFGSIAMTAGSCRNGQLSSSLQNTAAVGCFEVYAEVATSEGGNFSDGMHRRRICRCDRTTKTCVSCGSSGQCDPPQ